MDDTAAILAYIRRLEGQVNDLTERIAHIESQEGAGTVSPGAGVGITVTPDGIGITETPSGFGDEIRWYAPDGTTCKSRLYKNNSDGMSFQNSPGKGFFFLDTQVGGDPCDDSENASYIFMWPINPGFELYDDPTGLSPVFVGCFEFSGLDFFIQNAKPGGDVVIEYVGNVVGSTVRFYNDTLGFNPLIITHDGGIGLAQLTAPAVNAFADLIYVDAADGDLKIKFRNGVVKVIATN